MSQLGPARVCLLVLCCGLCGCAGLGGLLTKASSGDLAIRKKAYRRIEKVVRDLVPPNTRDAEKRAQVDQFLRQRFVDEKDTTLRSQIVALAVQGEFDCALELVTAAIGDRKEQRLVRLIAIQHLRDFPLAEHRVLITDCLLHEQDLQLRIEAAKAFGGAGSHVDSPALWATPLVNVFLDRHENLSLRFQAHRAASTLTGVECSMDDEKGWRAWLAEHPVAAVRP